MKNLKFLLFLGVLVVFHAVGIAGELLIEREARAEREGNPEEWVRVGSTDFFIAPFRVAPDWLSRNTERLNEDPFGGVVKPGLKGGAKGILESVGIPFPEGATATYVTASSEVVVRNTRENLELAQVFLDSLLIDPHPPKIAIRTEIYEVTPLQALQLQESAQAEADHKPERDAALRAVREGSANLVATHSLVTTGGQRAEVQDVTAMVMVIPAVDEESGKEVEELVERNYGTILEAEPNIEANESTITLNIALEHHTAKPERITVAGKNDRHKFHQKSVQSNLVLFSGNYILLATWKPTGKPKHAEGEFVQVVFVTASLQGLE